MGFANPQHCPLAPEKHKTREFVATAVCRRGERKDASTQRGGYSASVDVRDSDWK